MEYWLALVLCRCNPYWHSFRACMIWVSRLNVVASTSGRVSDYAISRGFLPDEVQIRRLAFDRLQKWLGVR